MKTLIQRLSSSLTRYYNSLFIQASTIIFNLNIIPTTVTSHSIKTFKYIQNYFYRHIIIL